MVAPLWHWLEKRQFCSLGRLWQGEGMAPLQRWPLAEKVCHDGVSGDLTGDIRPTLGMTGGFHRAQKLLEGEKNKGYGMEIEGGY